MKEVRKTCARRSRTGVRDSSSVGLRYTTACAGGADRASSKIRLRTGIKRRGDVARLSHIDYACACTGTTFAGPAGESAGSSRSRKSDRGAIGIIQTTRSPAVDICLGWIGNPGDCARPCACSCDGESEWTDSATSSKCSSTWRISGTRRICSVAIVIISSACRKS